MSTRRPYANVNHLINTYICNEIFLTGYISEPELPSSSMVAERDQSGASTPKLPSSRIDTSETINSVWRKDSDAFRQIRSIGHRRYSNLALGGVQEV